MPQAQEDSLEDYFSPCPRGLEALLVEELSTLGAQSVQQFAGGVGYRGDLMLACRVNLESRLATRVLLKLSQARYRSEDDIYRIAYALTWGRWFAPEQTFRVFVTASRSPLKSLNFATLRIKDAVCDHFRTVGGRRPNVDTERPDVRIHAFLDAETCSLYLDTSGEPLYKRGYKRVKVEAPLKENLAAGILLLTGWQPGQALLDPMCGSGTFLLEAAQMTLDIAPGLGRAFAFERMKRFDQDAWRTLRAAALARSRPAEPLALFGADIDVRQIRATEANLAAAGLEAVARLRVSDVLELDAPAPTGVMVANPPYGVRLSSGEELQAWYPQLGDLLKRSFAGWRCYFLSADMDLARCIGLKASRRTPLFNGDLECRLFEYRMVAGSNRPGNPEPI